MRTLADAYLARLGCERAEPSIDELKRLHRAQVERIPYETTWLHLGDRRGVDQSASIELIARQGRGGYCFHLNGAFAALLDDLGYHVTLHLGAVHHPDPDPAEFGNHLVLLVHDLPTDDNPDGTWYVDAGLGDALFEPLPLIAGTYSQAPAEYTLAQVDDGVGDWRLIPDALTGVDAMSFRRAPTSMDAFGETHVRLSTSEQSPFVRMVTIQRRHAGGSEVLRGRVLTERSTHGVRRSVIDGREAWFAVLADRFDLPLAHLDTDSLDRLWAHVESLGLPDDLSPVPEGAPT